MKGRGERIFQVFWVAFFILIIIRSLTYNPKARLIPLLVAGACLVMSITVLIGGYLRKERRAGRSGEDELLDDIMKKVDVAAKEDTEKEKMPPEEKRRRFRAAVGWILGFVLMVYLFGFLVTIPLFTAVYMRANGERWPLSLACAAGLLTVVYLTFVRLSQSTIYDGVIVRMLNG